VEVYGKSHRFTPGASQFIIDVHADNAYPALKFAGEVDGKFIFAKVVKDRPGIEAPANGEVVKPVNGKIVFRALQVKGAGKYTFDLVHESGKKLQFVSDGNEFVKSVYDFDAGVWQISCTPDNGNAGNTSCFAIRKSRKTSPPYLYGFLPASDSTVKSFGDIALKTLCDADQIDLNKSSFTIGGKKYALELLKGGRIGIPAGKIQLADGKIDIAADIYDHYGNYSHGEWCFFLNVEMHKTISFDENGILIFNGRKFLPLICYPPHGPAIAGDKGFNVMQPNALSHVPQLDILLKNNMKSLDAGCVYHGYYTKPDSTPAKDIANFMKGAGGSHPARLGAWLDELDAHLPDDKTRESLQDFQQFSMNCGVAGVCTTGRSRYADMAKMGDYLMIDIYPRANVLSVDYYFPKALRDAAGKPVWQLNQGFDYDWSNRNPATMIPNPAMLKYAHWAAFRHGLQGVGLYMCSSTAYLKFPEMWEHVVEMYRNSAALSFVLVEMPVKENVLTIPKPLNSRVIRYGERYYLIVQNSSLTSFPAVLEVNGSFESQVRVLFEDRVVTLKDGRFHDVFQGLESRIYELTVK
jgi:hypothetical protein